MTGHDKPISCAECLHYSPFANECVRSVQGSTIIEDASDFRMNSHHHDTCGNEAKYFKSLYTYK
jgi:hypothetical protein